MAPAAYGIFTASYAAWAWRPAQNLVEQVYGSTYQLPGGMLTLMTQSYRNGAVVSGNSWGPSGTRKRL